MVVGMKPGVSLIPPDRDGDDLCRRRCHEKKDRHENSDLPDTFPVQCALNGKFVAQGEDNHADDIVHDRRAQYNLPLVGMRPTHVGQNTHGDADAGRP